MDGWARKTLPYKDETAVWYWRCSPFFCRGAPSSLVDRLYPLDDNYWLTANSSFGRAFNRERYTRSQRLSASSRASHCMHEHNTTSVTQEQGHTSCTRGDKKHGNMERRQKYVSTPSQETLEPFYLKLLVLIVHKQCNQLEIRNPAICVSYHWKA